MRTECHTMNLSSCSVAVSGKPPTGFEAAITPSTSPSHDRRSWISAWNLWASRRASSSSCCLSAAFASKSLQCRFSCDNFSCVAEASAVPLPDSIIWRPASLSVSTLVWCAWISFTSTCYQHRQFHCGLVGVIWWYTKSITYQHPFP